MIPAPRFVGIAIFGHRGVLPQWRTEVTAGGRLHLHQTGTFQHLGGGQHPRFILNIRQHACQHLRRLDGQQNARAGFQDLLLFRRMQQHHGVDNQIGRLQRTLCRVVTGQRRIATVSRHVIAHRARMVERRQFYRVNPGTQAQCRIGGGAHRTRIGIVTFQDRHALRSINL
ncbi:hypothetical protein D3C80_1615340 [compost metagenome]